jgi:hypothetical protein
MATTNIATSEPVDMKLEVVVIGVSDVDRVDAGSAAQALSHS